MSLGLRLHLRRRARLLLRNGTLLGRTWRGRLPLRRRTRLLLRDDTLLGQTWRGWLRLRRLLLRNGTLLRRTWRGWLRLRQLLLRNGTLVGRTRHWWLGRCAGGLLGRAYSLLGRIRLWLPCGGSRCRRTGELTASFGSWHWRCRR